MQSKNRGLNILSLFDGMSCGQIALERAGIKVDNYFASEIKPHAIKVTQHNYPDTIQLGDVFWSNSWDLPEIDILIGGSPCQSISGMSQNGKGLKDMGKSGLFYYYLECLKKLKPKYFLLENVVGRKDATDEITKLMGVEPIKINSNLVSAQNRNRLYWTNIPNIEQPNNKNITCKDVRNTENDSNEKLFKSIKFQEHCVKQINSNNKYVTIAENDGKFQCITAGGVPKWNCSVFKIGDKYRIPSVNECEQFQTLPDNYVNSLISDNKAYELIGDGWTVDVIAHILKNIN